MTELVNGRTVAEAETVRLAFIEMMHAKGAGEPDEEVLGDAVAFAGVAKFPARIKCALLGWMALQDAEIQSGLLTDQTKEQSS
jgi:nitrogen fixation NifU-like protein